MKRILILVIAAIINYGPTALAIPNQINYQGYLTRPDGSPLDTTVAMRFGLYDMPSNGNEYWLENHTSVAVTGGLFNVQLGSITPIPDVFGSNRWLAVRIGNNSDMTPRQSVTSVTHAYRVGTVGGASGGTITGNVTILGKGNIGVSNYNGGDHCFVAGFADSVSGYASTITGGMGNVVDNLYTTVSGGFYNQANGEMATVGGGGANWASGNESVVSGGYLNGANGEYSGVSSGMINAANGICSHVGGGWYNAATGDTAIVSGGSHNTASGYSSTISGGSNNTAVAQRTVIGGGRNNTVEGAYTVISGGLDNSNDVQAFTAIGGGRNNHTGAPYATVPGGFQNQANGIYSFAAGDSARVTGANSFALGTNINCAADSAFVWSDGSGDGTGVGMSRTFNVKATRGTRIWTSPDISSGVTIGAGGNAWVAVSDSTRKRNIRGLDTQDILNRFSSLPIKRWEYKSEEQGVEHIGPMAQDFWNAFHLGNEPLGISTIDADGVMMAAIQGLAKRCDQLEQQNAILQKQIHSLLAQDEQTQLKKVN